MQKTDKQAGADVPLLLPVKAGPVRNQDLDLESNRIACAACCLLERCRDELVVLGSVSTRFNAKIQRGQVVSLLRGSRLLITLQCKLGTGPTADANEVSATQIRMGGGKGGRVEAT